MTRGLEPVRRGQAGFSLAEVIVATTIFMGLVLIVSTLAVSGSKAQDLGRRISRMTEVAQEVADDIRLELISSVRVFHNDGLGNATLAALDLTNAPEPVVTRRLPTVDRDGSFRRDTVGDEITGNTLLFAYLVWRDSFVCTSGKQYLVDVFRIVHYYVSPADGGPGPNIRGGLDLVRFESEPLADADAVDSIVDPVDRAEVLSHLANATPDAAGHVNDPVEVVWRRTGAPEDPGTLRQIDDTDGSLSDNPISGSGRPDPWAILPSTDHVVGLLAYRRAAVASNFDLVAPGISRFAIRDDAADFPHGFETQVTGPTSARRVLLHVVLIDSGRAGAPAWSQVQTIVTGHDR